MCANSATWNMNDNEDNDLLSFHLKYKNPTESLSLEGYRKAERRVRIFFIDFQTDFLIQNKGNFQRN